jgi:hypothetical protein
MWHRKRDLNQMLREDRPAPSDDFLWLAVGKMQAETGSRPRERGWFVRPLVTLAAGASVVLAFAALGGFSGLQSSVKQSPHLSPFVAAALNYCTAQVTVSIASGQDNPTTSSTINFTVDFHETVTGFTDSDIQVGGTAGGPVTAHATGGTGGIYTVAVTGMSSPGTVTVTIPGHAAVAHEGTEDCDTQASNTASVTYSTLRLTSWVPDGTSGNGKLAGSGAAVGTTVNVTICSTSSFPCSAGNTVATGSATPAADGTFQTVNFNQTKKGVTYYAQAVQGAVTSQIFSWTA